METSRKDRKDRNDRKEEKKKYTTMDLIIQQTDYDALSSKLASIQKRYLPPGPLVVAKTTGTGNETSTTEGTHLSNDQVVQFYRDITQIYSDYYHALKTQSRRVFGKINKAIDSSFPVMNYGTYLRTLAIDTSILNFIKKNLTSGQTHREFQIVNLGAGSDLRMAQYLSMFNSTETPDDSPQLLKFVDLDFKPAVDLKREILERINTGTQLADYLSDPRYALLACDLRDSKATLDTLRLSAGLDPQIPTIFISECVLCYMTQQDSQNLIDDIVREYSGGSNSENSEETRYLWVSYDPIGGEAADDKFGKIMRANLLESRNLDMPTLLTFNSKQSYSGRWNGPDSNNNNNNRVHVETDIVDMWEFLNTVVSNVEQRRLQGLQFLDEVEELKIMQSHYVLLNARWS